MELNSMQSLNINMVQPHSSVECKNRPVHTTSLRRSNLTLHHDFV